MYKAVTNRPVGVVVQDSAIGARGLGFDFRAGQIEHCRQGLTPLRHFFGAVLSMR